MTWDLVLIGLTIALSPLPIIAFILVTASAAWCPTRIGVHRRLGGHALGRDHFDVGADRWRAAPPPDLARHSRIGCGHRVGVGADRLCRADPPEDAVVTWRLAFPAEVAGTNRRPVTRRRRSPRVPVAAVAPRRRGRRVGVGDEPSLRGFGRDAGGLCAARKLRAARDGDLPGRMAPTGNCRGCVASRPG